MALKLPRSRRARLAFIAALFLCTNASVRAFETPMPTPQFTETGNDAVKADVPQSALRGYAYAWPGNRSYEWAAWFQLTDAGESGENVAAVAQAYHKGTASTWALNSEVHCLVPTAGCFGHENDIAVIGPAGGSLRIGAMNLAANLDPSKGTAEVDTMYLVAELPYRADKVIAKRGIAVDIICSMACLTVRAGQRIGLTEDGSTAVRFNPETKRIEFYIEGVLVYVMSSPGPTRKSVSIKPFILNGAARK